MQVNEASKSALHNEVLVVPESIRLPATGFDGKKNTDTYDIITRQQHSGRN